MPSFLTIPESWIRQGRAGRQQRQVAQQDPALRDGAYVRFYARHGEGHQVSGLGRDDRGDAGIGEVDGAVNDGGGVRLRARFAATLPDAHDLPCLQGTERHAGWRHQEIVRAQPQRETAQPGWRQPLCSGAAGQRGQFFPMYFPRR